MLREVCARLIKGDKHAEVQVYSYSYLSEDLIVCRGRRANILREGCLIYLSHTHRPISFAISMVAAIYMTCEGGSSGCSALDSKVFEECTDEGVNLSKKWSSKY
jgi:hypothetical protein